MAFNWTQFANAINLAPYVVAGAVIPGEEPIIQAASAGIASVIATIQNIQAAQKAAAASNPTT